MPSVGSTCVQCRCPDAEHELPYECVYLEHVCLVCCFIPAAGAPAQPKVTLYMGADKHESEWRGGQGGWWVGVAGGWVVGGVE